MLFFRKFTIVIIILSAYITAGELRAADELENIQQKVTQYLKRTGARSANWGIRIFDPEDNKVLVEINPDNAFLPASVMKVLTTATAIEKLGPDFRYRTGVYADGTLDENGVLDGNIILVGRGDPNLLDTYGDLGHPAALPDLAEKIKALGILEIKGDVIGDDSYFAPSVDNNGKLSADMGTFYGAPVTALSINNNVIKVTARAPKSGKAVTVALESGANHFRISNKAAIGDNNAKQTLSIQLQRTSNTLAVSGVLPASKTVTRNVVLNRPAETTAAIFKSELERRGIRIKGKVRAIHHGDAQAEDKESWTFLTEHKSLPLVRGLEIINKRSQNLHAEMLLRTLGAELLGVGSNEAGLEAVKAFLVNAGIDNENIQLNDGCGLSRENFLTPRFQTALLEYLLRQPYFNLFHNTLSVSGTDGTLRNRLSSGNVKGYIYAKTGSLKGVSTLSGYITTQSGKNLIFSIFANRVTATNTVKKTIDEICSLFATLY
jgi:D-alanyl-D-alanine carboxypeptidase/D-alanyl-D-alanine-endopeptidase (penicillin-binding protein 4)